MTTLVRYHPRGIDVDLADLPLARYKEARKVIDTATYPGASLWQPSSATPRTQEAAQTYTVPCHHGGALYAVQPEPPNPQPTPTAPPLPYQRTPLADIAVEWITCQICGKSASHPDSIQSGLCRGCDFKLNRFRSCERMGEING